MRQCGTVLPRHRQVAQREYVRDGRAVRLALQTIPMGEVLVFAAELEQARDHALAGIDIAAVDDVAPARHGKRRMRAEERPFGAIDEGLEAREVEKIRTVEVLRRAGIERVAVDDSGRVAVEAEVRVPTICA
jgi:hypothetical protein